MRHDGAGSKALTLRRKVEAYGKEAQRIATIATNPLSETQLRETKALYAYALKTDYDAQVQAALRASLEDAFAPMRDQSVASFAQRNAQIDAVVAWRKQPKNPLPEEAANYLKAPVLESMRRDVTREMARLKHTPSRNAAQAEAQQQILRTNAQKIDHIVGLQLGIRNEMETAFIDAPGTTASSRRQRDAEIDALVWWTQYAPAPLPDAASRLRPAALRDLRKMIDDQIKDIESMPCAGDAKRRSAVLDCMKKNRRELTRLIAQSDRRGGQPPACDSGSFGGAVGSVSATADPGKRATKEKKNPARPLRGILKTPSSGPRASGKTRKVTFGDEAGQSLTIGPTPRRAV